MARPRLTSDDFQAWRAHPVTEVVDRYRKDFAAWIRANWAQGEMWTDEARMQVQNLEDEAGLGLGSIETFYEAREEDGQAEIQDGGESRLDIQGSENTRPTY